MAWREYSVLFWFRQAFSECFILVVCTTLPFLSVIIKRLEKEKVMKEESTNSILSIFTPLRVNILSYQNED